MSDSHSVYHGIKISRCNVLWSELNGDDVERKCQRCGVLVYSAPGELHSRTLWDVQSSPGKLQLYRRFDGTITRDCQPCSPFPNLEPAMAHFLLGVGLCFLPWCFYGGPPAGAVLCLSWLVLFFGTLAAQRQRVNPGFGYAVVFVVAAILACI